MSSEITVYGSHCCPKTIAALPRLEASGISYIYKDISGSMIFLKEFLALRDSNTAFESVKRAGRVGTPCFVLPDGKISFDVSQFVK
jgi:glutaredoxin-related protein